MKTTLSYRGSACSIACFMVGSLLPLAQMKAEATFSESFEGAPFAVASSIDGVRGWRVSSSNPSLDNNAGMIRAGVAPDGAQYLEIKARGTEPRDSTRIVNDLGTPLSLPPGRAQRIAVAMNYVNLEEFSSSGGIIFRVYTEQGDFAVSLNAKKQNAILLRKAAKARTSETMESGSLIRQDTWYRFAIDLHPAATPGGNATLRVTLTGAQDDKTLWTVDGWDLGFSPSQITRIELAANRLADSEAHRVGYFDQIAISEAPSP